MPQRPVALNSNGSKHETRIPRLYSTFYKTPFSIALSSDHSLIRRALRFAQFSLFNYGSRYSRRLSSRMAC